MRTTGPIGLSNVGRFFSPQGLAANATVDTDTPYGGIPKVVWVDDPPLPTLPAKIAAILAIAVVAGPVDTPPSAQVPRFVEIADPLPTLPKRNIVQPGIVQIDNPSFGRKPYVWPPRTADPLPTLPRKIAAVLADTNAPPPLRRSQDWTPWYDTVPVKLTVSRAATEGAAVIPPAVVDNPPFGLYRPQVWAWGPYAAFPGSGGQLVPEAADNPPFGKRRFQDWFHWYDIVAVKLTVSRAATAGEAVVIPPAQVDNPPFGLYRPQVWAWGPYAAFPGASGQLVPEAVNNPPFSARHVQDWTHWFRPYPLPTLTAKLVQPGAAAPVITPDNPAGKGVPRIVTVADPPLPTLNRKLVQPFIPPPVNDPPFNSRRRPDWFHWFDTVPIRLVVSYAATEGAPSVPVVEPPVEPPVVAPSPGGVGRVVGRGGKPLYKTVKLKKKRLKEECEELLKYLADLPPAQAQEICEALPAERLSLLDGLVLPHGIVLKTTATTVTVLVDEDEDEEEIALLLGILFDA